MLGADVTPGTLPDLYRGEPLVIAARIPGARGLEGAHLDVEGMIGEQPWKAKIPLGRAHEGMGLSKLWARRKIADAEVQRALRQATPEEADKRILTLALEHHLVTRLTSLVAVEKTPSRPDGAKLTRADIPLNLPAGWDFERVFGERRPADLPRTPGFDTPELGRPTGGQRADNAAPLRQAIKVASANFQAVASASQPRPIVPAAQQVPLPRTATDAELRMMIGFALLLVAVLLLALRLHRERLLTGGVPAPRHFQ